MALPKFWPENTFIKCDLNSLIDFQELQLKNVVFIYFASLIIKCNIMKYK